MKGKGLLFGLNYSHCKAGKLNGCINDVKQISQLISSVIGGSFPIDIYTDDIDRQSTSYDGIMQKLYHLAIESYSDNLDFVWIHYSGHGSQQKDLSQDPDELDGMDEGLVPSDYETKGILIDDILNNIIQRFNPKTKILFICDACHSGSILDLTYIWDAQRRQGSYDNKNCAVKAQTLLISGCQDNQTSADAFNLLGDSKSIGALTACIVKVLKNKPYEIDDVFTFIESVRAELKRGGFKQYPCLSSNYDLNRDPLLIPDIHSSCQTAQSAQQVQALPQVQQVQQIPQQPSYNNQSYYNRPPKLYYESNNSYIYNYKRDNTQPATQYVVYQTQTQPQYVYQQPQQPLNQIQYLRHVQPMQPSQQLQYVYQQPQQPRQMHQPQYDDQYQNRTVYTQGPPHYSSYPNIVSYAAMC